MEMRDRAASSFPPVRVEHGCQASPRSPCSFTPASLAGPPHPAQGGWTQVSWSSRACGWTKLWAERQVLGCGVLAAVLGGGGAVSHEAPSVTSPGQASFTTDVLSEGLGWGQRAGDGSPRVHPAFRVSVGPSQPRGPASTLSPNFLLYALWVTVAPPPRAM